MRTVVFNAYMIHIAFENGLRTGPHIIYTSLFFFSWMPYMLLKCLICCAFKPEVCEMDGNFQFPIVRFTKSVHFSENATFEKFKKKSCLVRNFNFFSVFLSGIPCCSPAHNELVENLVKEGLPPKKSVFALKTKQSLKIVDKLKFMSMQIYTERIL